MNEFVFIAVTIISAKALVRPHTYGQTYSLVYKRSVHYSLLR